MYIVLAVVVLILIPIIMSIKSNDAKCPNQVTYQTPIPKHDITCGWASCTESATLISLTVANEEFVTANLCCKHAGYVKTVTKEGSLIV